MKIFARRVEAPTPDKPYATKWQIAVGASATDPALRFFDRVEIWGESFVEIEEADNPAVFIRPHLFGQVIGYQNGIRVELQ